MGDGDEFNRERADRDLLAMRDDPHGNLGRARFAEPTGLGEPGGKARQIDRRSQARPEFGERADVILVRMGYDDADEILPRFLDEAQIGHDEIDPGQILARKGDAEIDHQPLARPRGPIAIKRAIHADLAQAPERSEHELVVVRHLKSPLPRASVGRGRPRRVGSGQYPQVSSLDGLQSAVRSHEQAAVRIDPLEHALAPDAAVFDRDGSAKADGAIEPRRANASERVSSAPLAKRLLEPLQRVGRTIRLG